MLRVNLVQCEAVRPLLWRVVLAGSLASGLLLSSPCGAQDAGELLQEWRTVSYTHLDVYKRQVPQIEADLAGLNRDYAVNRRKFEDLLTRRESAKMSQQIEQTSQDVRFKIIDPLRVPLRCV